MNSASLPPVRIAQKRDSQRRDNLNKLAHTDIYAKSLYQAEDGDMNKLEQKLIMELTALPNVRWLHRNISRQGFCINGYINHYPDILILTEKGKIIFADWRNPVRFRETA